MTIKRFKLRAEDGTIYHATCSRSRVRTTSLDDTHHSSVRGLPDFRLDDGRNLTRIDEDTFEIRGTGQRLTRV